MSTLYFLLAHLLADFVLQPEKLVKWKERSWLGTAFHGGVHFVITLLLFVPYFVFGGQGGDGAALIVFSAFGLAVAHAIIDAIKIVVGRRSKRFVKLFLGDQLAHLVAIAMAGMVADSVFVTSGKLPWWYVEPSMVIGICLLLIVSYGYELLLFQKRREANVRAKFKPDYKHVGRRVVLWAAIYGIIVIFGVYGTAAFV